MIKETEGTDIPAIIPLETKFSIKRTKPEEQEPTRLMAQIRVMVGNPLLAYIIQPNEVRTELAKFQSSIITAIYEQRADIFRVTTQSGSEYILTIENPS